MKWRFVSWKFDDLLGIVGKMSLVINVLTGLVPSVIFRNYIGFDLKRERDADRCVMDVGPSRA